MTGRRQDVHLSATRETAEELWARDVENRLSSSGHHILEFLETSVGTFTKLEALP